MGWAADKGGWKNIGTTKIKRKNIEHLQCFFVFNESSYIIDIKAVYAIKFKKE